VGASGTHPGAFLSFVFILARLSCAALFNSGAR
jgi:hypothetical protein